MTLSVTRVVPQTPRHWLYAQLQPVRCFMVKGICAGVLQSAVMCAAAWLLAYLLDQAIFHQREGRDVWALIAMVPMLAVVRIWLIRKQRHATFQAGAAISQRLQDVLERNMQTLGPLWASGRSSGDMVTRLVDGIDALIPYYAGYLPQTVSALVIPALVLLTVTLIDPWSALVLVITAPLLPIFMLWVGRAAEQASQKRWLRLRRLGAQFMDALAGLTTLRLYRAAERKARELAETGEAYRHDTMAILRIAFLSGLVMEFFGTVSIAVLAVLIGFRLLGRGLGFEQGFLVLLLAPEFFLPLRLMGAQRHQRMDAVAAATDLMTLLAAGQEKDEDCLWPYKSIHARHVAIDFEHVSFRYAESCPVLRDIELSIEAGMHLTLVGATGGGKSTLMLSLMGFIRPDSGKVLINGENLAELDPEAWRRHIAWVPQRPHIFRGTLRDNLLIASPDADGIDLEQAMDATGLTDVVRKLPLGLDNPLGELGYGLSGGERQRVALTRAWLRNAPLWLLDEPWQHLDEHSARRLEQALQLRTKRCTVLRIAHHLNTVANDEHVLVLADGRIAERGAAGWLRARDSLFAHLSAQERME